jgi:hypothetical protein
MKTTVTPATIQEACYVAKHMRDVDKHEIWASHHAEPMDAMVSGVKQSALSFTVAQETPILIFGVTSCSFASYRGILWMLATDQLYRVRYRFIRHGPLFVQFFLQKYFYLDNFVHVDNRLSIRWLKFCGATIEKAVPFGKEKEFFHHFYFRRQ